MYIDKDGEWIWSYSNYAFTFSCILLEARFIESKSGNGDFIDILNDSSALNQEDELRSPNMFMKRYGLLKSYLKRIYPCSTFSKTLKTMRADIRQKCSLPVTIIARKRQTNATLSCSQLNKKWIFSLLLWNFQKFSSCCWRRQKRWRLTGDLYKKYVKDDPINEWTITM